MGTKRLRYTVLTKKRYVQWKLLLFFKIFCWTKVYFEATDCPHFGLHVTLSIGFKARWFSGLLTCLRMVNLKLISGATPAFSTTSGVHCISVYTAGLPSRLPSCKQRRAGNGGRSLGQQWDSISCFPLDKLMCNPPGHAYRLRTVKPVIWAEFPKHLENLGNMENDSNFSSPGNIIEFKNWEKCHEKWEETWKNENLIIVNTLFIFSCMTELCCGKIPFFRS